MGLLETIYVLTYRELKSAYGTKEDLLMGLISAIADIAIFGFGFGSAIGLGVSNYLLFLAPGLLAAAAFYVPRSDGLHIFQERIRGFLRGLQIAPVPRLHLVLGKATAAIADMAGFAVVYVIMLFALGVRSTLSAFLLVPIAMVLMALGSFSLGAIIGCRSKSWRTNQLMGNTMLWPVFMMCGAYFPLTNISGDLATILYLNPFVYSTDLIRWAFYGIGNISLFTDISVVVVFDAVMLALAAFAFEKMRFNDAKDYW